MTDFRFAVVTLSYTPDFERCELLAWSVQQFLSPPVKHYIVVTQQDYPLFKQLQGPRTEIITVESVLPWWLFKSPLFKKGWISFKTLPVRNWILQQVVKLSVGCHLSEDVLIYVDSDYTFVRPFNLNRFVQGDKVRLFHAGMDGEPDEWCKATAQLLKIPVDRFPNYVSSTMTWRRDTLLKLHDYIQDVTGRSAAEGICRQWHFSEYALYGTFADYVLKEDAGHYWCSWSPAKEYWNAVNMTDEQLEQFFADLTPDQAAVMISAKAQISPKRYRKLIEALPKQALPMG